MNKAACAARRNFRRPGSCTAPIRERSEESAAAASHDIERIAQMMVNPRPQLGHQFEKYFATRAKRNKKPNESAANEIKVPATIASFTPQPAREAGPRSSHAAPAA